MENEENSQPKEKDLAETLSLKLLDAYTSLNKEVLEVNKELFTAKEKIAQLEQQLSFLKSRTRGSTGPMQPRQPEFLGGSPKRQPGAQDFRS